MLNAAGNLVDAITDFAVNTQADDLPASTAEAVKRLTLDSLGVAVAGKDEPGVAESRELVERWGGAPEATMWLSNLRVPLPNAAFVNSAMIHALDFDDKHYAAGMHVMSTTLPAVLGVAEMSESSGEEVLAAMAVGIEISTLIGEALMEARMDRGFLPASLVGGFGATAAASRLFGLSVENTRNALGLWYGQASGNRQALLDRSLGKRLQPAFAARSAIWAVELARLGVSGPEGALDGQAGLFQLYAGIEPPEIASGDTWAAESYWIKQYPSCGGCHRPTEAAILLAGDNDIDYRQVESAVVQVGESSGWHLGSPFEVRSDPQVDAQFSIAYSVALGLARRRAFLGEYETAQILADSEVIDLARRVDVQILPDTSHLRSDQVEVSLRVKMKDGSVLEKRVRDLRGSPLNPMSFDQVAEKFFGCCDFADIEKDRADAVSNAVSGLENADSIKPLLSALAAVGERSEPAPTAISP